MQWSWHIFIYCSLGTSRIWWFWSRFAEARSSCECKTHSHLLWYSAQCMKKRTLNEMKRTGTSANAIPLQPATVYYKVTCHTLNSHHDDKILLKMFSLTGDPMAPFGPGVPGWPWIRSQDKTNSSWVHKQANSNQEMIVWLIRSHLK